MSTPTSRRQAYPYCVRVKIQGIDLYSVGVEDRQRAQHFADLFDKADGVEETEVVSL